MTNTAGVEDPWTRDGPLTDRLVAALTPPDKGNTIRWDGQTPGLGVRVTAAGARAFVLRYRNANGRDTQLTIGSPPAWNVTKARKHAEALRYEIDLGADPLAEQKATRTAPTVSDLADRFEAEHLPKRRPATVRDYQTMIRLYIRPELGRMKVTDVRSDDIERLHRKIAKRAPYAANRTVALLSKMFSLAVRWGLRRDNPVRGIERAPEHKRERFLSPAEIARLGQTLAAHSERTSANAIRLLLLTGARRSEVLGATWDQFDIASGVWTKPAATTKKKKLHRVPLSAPALQLLTEMQAGFEKENARRARDGLLPLAALFPGHAGKAISEIKKFWASVCRKAGIQGARIHDLRHTHAAVLASAGLSLPIIGSLLGHSQPSTTARYAHLIDDTLRAATERAGAIITGAGKDGADVVPLPVPGRRA